jgi:hypothetical protein
MQQLEKSGGNKIGKRKLATSITLTGDDVSALIKYVSVGAVILQTSHPVIAKLKGACSRLGMATPHGLPKGPRRRRLM